jgi:hAT family C-terminal dimerisation region
MILDILLISAMSNELERVFSEAHHTVSWEKVQMNAETLKYVECLKYWKQNGILNEWLNKK